MENENENNVTNFDEPVSKHYLITTIDNPYNPFTEFMDWYRFDCVHNYGTNEKLARLARTSEMFSDEENAEETEKAVEIMLKNDLFGMYKKAFETDNFRETAVELFA